MNIQFGNRLLYRLLFLLLISQAVWGQTPEDWASGAGNTIGHSGWAEFKNVFAGNNGVIYGIYPDGRLIWYRHEAYLTGEERWAPGSGAQIGSGWHIFSSVFAGDEGVIYGMKPDGTLYWYRHLGHMDGTENWAQGSGKQIGSGWQVYSGRFAGNNGVIYAIMPDGQLMWYQHRGYLDGSDNWASNAGSRVGTGWHVLKHVMATDLGMIFGVDQNGTMWWYQRPHPESNQENWVANTGLQIGTSWNFKSVLAGGVGTIYAVTHDGKLKWYRYLNGANPGGPLTPGWRKLTDVSELRTGSVICLKALGYLSDPGHGIFPCNRFLSLTQTNNLVANSAYAITTFEVETVSVGPNENYTNGFDKNFDPNAKFIKVLLKASNGKYVRSVPALWADVVDLSGVSSVATVLMLTRDQPNEVFKFIWSPVPLQEHLDQTVGPFVWTKYGKNLHTIYMRGRHDAYKNSYKPLPSDYVNFVRNNFLHAQFEIYYK